MAEYLQEQEHGLQNETLIALPNSFSFTTIKVLQIEVVTEDTECCITKHGPNTGKPTSNGSNIKRTTALEWTAAKTTGGYVPARVCVGVGGGVGMA